MFKTITFRTVLAACAIALAVVSASGQQKADNAAQLELQQMRDAARAVGVPEHRLPRYTFAQLQQKKLNMQQWEKKVTWSVLDRYERLIENDLVAPGRRAEAAEFAVPNVPIDAQARVMVELEVVNDRVFSQNLLDQYGAQLVTRTDGYGYVVVWVPAENLPAIAQRADVKHILDVGVPYTDLGTFTTEGDAVHNADDVRNDRGLSGAGEHIGAISDGVDNLAAAQGTGDLPAVNVLDNGSGGDEGTGMLEICADLAPNATYSFHTGFPGIATMVNAVNDLVAAGCTIITDDLPFPGGARLFERGPIEQAKVNATTSGVFYTCSAGNRGNEHWEGNFDLQTGPPVDFGPITFASAHAWNGNNDVSLSATVTANSGNATFYLQWAEQFGSAGIDLDLIVLDNAGNVIGSSIDFQDGDDNPQETVNISVASGAVVRVVVNLFNPANTNVFIDLRAFGTGNWEYLIPQGSINGASRAAELYAAGAVDATAPNIVRGFSSRGPIQEFFPANVTRMKPEGVAANGVSISGAGGFGAGTCPGAMDGDCLFFGTSASTPHVAGLAALINEQLSGITPADMIDALNTMAVDIDLPGPDNNAGFGRIDVQAALDELFPDCDLNGLNDDDEIAGDPTLDCNGNGILDVCDIDPADPDGDGLVSPDCQPNGIPDECDIDPTDPDGDGLVSPDCQPNGVPDECDIADGTSEDCNNNAVPDECDIATGFSEDCNTDGIPDECQLGNCLNQYSTTTGGAASDLACEDCSSGVQVMADQFVLSGGSSVVGLRWRGAYAPADDASIHDRFFIEIRPDNGGEPGAAPVATLGPFEADLKLDTGDTFPSSRREFEYTHMLPNPVALGAGTYWVLIYNDTQTSPDFWNWSIAPTDPVSGIPGRALSSTGPNGPWNSVASDCALQVYCDEPDNDCNSDGIPDDCQLGMNDCNNNGIPDDCDTKPDGDPSIAVEQDLCEDAMLVCPGFDYVGDSAGSTLSDGTFFCGLFYSTRDVWYRYRPAHDGLAFIRVEGPPLYWVYAVYDGCPSMGGLEIDCNTTDHFQITFHAEAGQEYYIRIGAHPFDTTGTFEMNLVGPPCALSPIDLDGNGIPDECECAEDVNSDNMVDMLDYLEALTQYGSICPCTADVNSDGVVNDTDLSLILNNIGPCPTPLMTLQHAPGASPLEGLGGDGLIGTPTKR